MNGSAASSVRRQMRPAPGLALLLVAFALWPAAASAQLSRVGNSKGVVTPLPVGVRGSDVAYDPARGVFLVVGAYGDLRGVFTNASGDVVPGTSQFAIGSGNGTDPAWAAFPRVAYSPDVNNGQGGFLVSWVQFNGAANIVRVAVVAYPGVQVTAEQAVLVSGSAWGESAASVAYSPTSDRFLVAWNTVNPDHQIHGRFVGLDGVPTGSVMTLENAGADRVRDPGLAWNAATDEFGLSMTGYGAGPAFAAFKRIGAGAGALSARTTFGYSAGTFITDVTVNPSTNHWIMGWSSGGPASYAEIDTSGNVLGTGPIGVGSYDGFSLTYNSSSGSILVVGHGQTSNVHGIELNGQGVPIGSAQVLTSGASNGSFYPRAAARTDAKQWNISYARDFLVTANQIIETATSLAGPVSDVRAAIEEPTNGRILGSSDTLTVKGYATDRGATNGSGIDVVWVVASPSSGGPDIDIGLVYSFSARSDLTNTLGVKFANIGFTASKSGLPAGDYTVRAKSHSTVTDKWSEKTVSISVVGSLPLMSLDTPDDGSTIMGAVTASGWAIDKVASSGTGINAVHVWAFPTNGDSPRLLGAATLGLSRTDVGSFFQKSQFNNSGFSVTGYLPTGSYKVVAYARDSYSNGFNVAASKSLTVRSGFIAIDAPANGAAVSLGATISGWAADLGASAGSGIDFIHVYGVSSNGANVWVGAASLGGSRPDVGAALGSSQFNNSGYSLPLQNLTAGTYTLTVFAHSSVTGAVISSVVPITVN